MPSKVRMHRQHIGRLIFMAVLAGILTLPVTWRGKLALVAIAMICGMYAMAFQRLRKRRIGSAAVGSFYDMLEHDKRKAMEIIVEKKAEEQMPEDAEGGPDPSR